MGEQLRSAEQAEQKCVRWRFTQEQFDAYKDSFWPMPPEWGVTDGTSMLRRIWGGGGVGAVSILPLLGQFVHTLGPKGVTLSKEELARLAGIHPETVAKGGKALANLDLAVPSTVLRTGKRVTRWQLRPALAAAKGVNGRLGEYFYVPSRFLYGGNWAQLTGVQRALYLAVGSQSRVFEERPETNGLLKLAGVQKGHRVDMDRAWESSVVKEAGEEKHYLRLACLSFRELSQITGMAKSTIVKAIQQLKHPNHWRDCKNDPRRLRHNPIGVYPTAGGSFVYHFRDHAEPWPWEMLNGEPSRWDAWIGELDAPLAGRR